MKQRLGFVIVLTLILLAVVSLAGYLFLPQFAPNTALATATATPIQATAVLIHATQGLSESDPVLVGAGDIGECGSGGAEATARLLDLVNGTVMAVGDIAYDSGTADEFQRCYDPNWGRYKDRTRPVPGNHEYVSSGAAPYYDYFGKVAGDADKSYYSYDLGAWHIIALNSNIPADAGSDQQQWLQDDLNANKTLCTLAYWHHPVFSSGQHGNDSKMLDVWRLLYEHRADIVVNGHDHDYERFAPQTPSGKADPQQGIREFVAGTGGAALRPFSRLAANSELRDSNTWGVLELTLHRDAYDWEFVPVAGKPFHDSGTGRCVN